ncbi:MAG: TIM-barrel domain-containing protein [Bacteroidota bacterium]
MIENFEFKTVEQFFEDHNGQQGYRNWSQLGKVENYQLYENTDQVGLTFKNEEGNDCVMSIHFPSPNTFRLRFNPGIAKIEDYPEGNTRSIVKDTFTETARLLGNAELKINENNGNLEIEVQDEATKKIKMKVVIRLSKYAMTVFKPDNNGQFYKAHGDADIAIYYKKRMCYTEEHTKTVEYSVIQAKEMPSSAKYIGFGEKGGRDLYRNGARLTYFNFDNMRYKQIYGNGPLDIREPLYDSNPFYMELNGVPGQTSIYGIFTDNTSATFFDLGSYNNNQEYLFGSLYGSMDYYFFLGDDPQEILESYLSFVGTTRLKPRFILGYHQGCYGYENEYLLQDAVNGYRGNNIPLDGLHVDVDIQKNYSTFTMDEAKFSTETFDKLAERGIKCSTNITPVVSYTNTNYKTFESGNKNDCFVKAATVNDAGKTGYYEGGVYYGGNRGTFGHYPDFGNKETRYWWGQQYRLLYSRGLQMVWQDMTTPAIPNPQENWNVELYSEKDQTSYKIGDRITSSMRSFPFDLLVTDNSIKKYKGEVAEVPADLPKDKSPAARIRNLYSYNLHKATYHGLNFIWLLNEFTFTVVGNTGLSTDESKSILSALASKNIIQPIPERNDIYEVIDNVNLDDPNIDLGLPSDLAQYRDEIIYILKQSVVLKARRNNKRNFIIGRGGFTGMHRFAGLWTGDNSSSWDFLKINITQVLALGLAGQSMSGQDIGGFERENDWQKWADPELLIRWTAAGAFLPWFRNHYIQKGQKLFQEPYKYQDYKDQAPPEDQYLYDAVLPVCRYYIQLRYRLMQLFYDCMFENTLGGLPISRPLFLLEHQDASLFGTNADFLNTQLFVGNDLLVAPVTEKESWGSQGRRNVYLPTGSNWFAFKNNTQALSEKQAGGTTVAYDAHISTDPQHIPFVVPMYVREGAVIPTVEIEQYVGQLHKENKPNPVTLNFYPGQTGRYEMYTDDGVSRSSAPAGKVENGADPEAKGEYRKTIITHQQNGNNKTIEVKWVHNNYQPKENFFFAAILHEPTQGDHPVQQIGIKTLNISQDGFDYTLPEINGGSTDQNAAQLWNSNESAWYYNSNIHISFIKIFTPKSLENLDNGHLSEENNVPEPDAMGIALNVQFK